MRCKDVLLRALEAFRKSKSLRAELETLESRVGPQGMDYQAHGTNVYHLDPMRKVLNAMERREQITSSLEVCELDLEDGRNLCTGVRGISSTLADVLELHYVQGLSAAAVSVVLDLPSELVTKAIEEGPQGLDGIGAAKLIQEGKHRSQ